MKWSLNTYQTAQDWSLDETLRIAKVTGYDGVEFLMDFKQQHGFEWDTPRENWKPLKERVAESGLAISSLTSCQVFHSPDASERATSADRVKRVIEMSAYMGCSHVRVLGDRFTPETRDSVIGWVTEALRTLGENAAGSDVTVSIEMHGSFTDPDAAMKLIEGVNLPNVGFVFNSQFVGCEAGSIVSLFSRVAPHITSVHTHQAEKPETFELYRQMFRWLRRIGFSGYISNECAYRGPDPEKVLALYVALFKALAA
ncbi:sugar phosphate isomerase/epimerase [Candidatus Poribacteria bacterium]|nr:sugar phosphate isomerase/epimerase [Candidatus Poribacteria bacterium]